MTDEQGEFDPHPIGRAWEAAAALMALVDPIVADEDSHSGGRPVASLRESVVVVGDGTVDIRLTYRLLRGTKQATLLLHLDAAALVAEHAADFRTEGGPDVPEGFSSDTLFLIDEFFEHSVNWSDSADEHHAYDQA